MLVSTVHALHVNRMWASVKSGYCFMSLRVCINHVLVCMYMALLPDPYFQTASCHILETGRNIERKAAWNLRLKPNFTAMCSESQTQKPWLECALFGYSFKIVVLFYLTVLYTAWTISRLHLSVRPRCCKQSPAGVRCVLCLLTIQPGCVLSLFRVW